MDKTTIHTERAPGAIGPYSQAIRTGNLVYCSGQIGLDPQQGQITAHDVAGQTRQALRNLSAVLEAAGTDLRHVVKTTVFLVHMSDFAAMNEAYAEFFRTHPPARSTVAVAELPRQALVEIEAVAVAGPGPRTIPA
jgi:2-iminobutanoate/2-iminopropanoate deaminase